MINYGYWRESTLAALLRVIDAAEAIHASELSVSLRRLYTRILHGGISSHPGVQFTEAPIVRITDWQSIEAAQRQILLLEAGQRLLVVNDQLSPDV